MSSVYMDIICTEIMVETLKGKMHLGSQKLYVKHL